MSIQPRVKGIVFRTTTMTFAKLTSQGTVDRAMSLTSEPLRSSLRGRLILSSAWYPLDWYKQWLHAMRDAHRSGSEFIKTVVREGVLHDLGGVYRIFLLVMSPEGVIPRASRLFSTYYDTGAISVEVSRPGMSRVRCTGCTGFDELLWQSVIGGAEAALIAAGAKHVRFHTLEGGKDGDDFFCGEAHWVA
jgi:hypothetical protein